MLFGCKTYKEIVIYLEQRTLQTVFWSPGVLSPAVILNIMWLLPRVTAALPQLLCCTWPSYRKIVICTLGVDDSELLLTCETLRLIFVK